MPRINFVVARNDDDARELASKGFGVGTLPEARNVLANVLTLALPGEYGIYAVNLQVKRLDIGVGSA